MDLLRAFVPCRTCPTRRQITPSIPISSASLIPLLKTINYPLNARDILINFDLIVLILLNRNEELFNIGTLLLLRKATSMAEQPQAPKPEQVYWPMRLCAPSMKGFNNIGPVNPLKFSSEASSMAGDRRGATGAL